MDDLQQLSQATLAKARDVQRPAYDRTKVTPGIVHLGLGNFHRAHQAVYIDDCLEHESDWGIVGVSLRRPDMRDALLPQDGLYTMLERSGGSTKARIIGSVVETLFSGADREKVMARLVDPATRIISLTVTEKGYCHDPANGRLNADHIDVRHDVEHWPVVRSVPGLLASALAARRARSIAPFSVLSCDNLPANGQTVQRVTADFAALVDDSLAAHIESDVAFASTMVDRIVPATTDDDRRDATALSGLIDRWPVATEPFSQWVIEDRFGQGRPRFEAVGAELVGDVAPYEHMKLRMLNGAHSTLAYFGQLLGLETVADAMGDRRLGAYVAAMWDRETMPTLALPTSTLATYADALKQRFLNPALRHKTAQIAMDGSQKVPQRLLATIADQRALGAPHGLLTGAVAAWMVYVANRDGRFAIDDPLAARFADFGRASGGDMARFAGLMLDQADVLGALGAAPQFRAAIIDKVMIMSTEGPASVLQLDPAMH